MDLFNPLVPIELWHPNFKAFMHDSFKPSREVLETWAEGFVDRDNKFVKEFQTTFNSSLWELYLFAVLKDLNCTVDFNFKSPDFVTSSNYGNFALEAVIASHAQDSVQEWNTDDFMKNPQARDMVRLIEDATIRLSNAITNKREKYKKHYGLNPIINKLPFVIGVSPFDRPHAHSQNQEAINLLLLGSRVHRRKDGTAVVVEQKTLPKGKSLIQTGLFTGPYCEEVSAIVFSNTATAGKLRALSNDDSDIYFGVMRYAKYASKPDINLIKKSDYHENLIDGIKVYHNPYARYPLDLRLFERPGISQYWFDESINDFVTDARNGDLIQRFCIKLTQAKK